ncbi:hypothetical protein CPHO_07060 [Corynebacterium phocae]|uniref:Uncharacterized protein n=1 Tax=Corynebacterium phocae TaxID=161895 RepID=A0A1L7D434_9CORY|nr:hypothetical protein CPHO_07060 [Corynebacterium phocae]
MPEGSALHRAKNGGHTWTTLHSILWGSAGELYRASSFWRGYLKVKNDRFEWPATPWEEKNDSSRYGRVEDSDRAAAAAYLMSFAPPSGA